MSAPVILSVQYTDTQLLIIFDQAITNVADLSAFTFTQTSTNPYTPTFSNIEQNAIINTVTAAPDSALTVTYTDPGSGVGQVLSLATSDPAENFSVTAIEQFPTPTTLVITQATLGGGSPNDQIDVSFSQPIAATDGDLLAGWSVRYNGEALDLTTAGAVLSADQRVLSLTTGVNAPYNAFIEVDYDDAAGALYTWGSGTSDFVGSYSGVEVQNLSTDGLPDSQYPNSFVWKPQVELRKGIAAPQLEVSLNPVDIKLVRKYGPLRVYTGGAGFYPSADYPDGTDLVGGVVDVVDGTVISIRVNVGNNAVQAAGVAEEWQQVVTARLGIALGRLRATDQGVVLAGAAIVAV